MLSMSACCGLLTSCRVLGDGIGAIVSYPPEAGNLRFLSVATDTIRPEPDRSDAS